MNVVDVKGLVRYYGGARGVDGIDLEVPLGSVMGLLGPNGGGKTTTLKLLLGQLVPNQGSALLFDHDPLELPPEVRSRIAYVADEVELPAWMKLKEGMELYASYYPQWNQAEADALIVRFDLDMGRPFGKLSKGQKRRFFLMLAVAQQPDLLILDEPAGGLDAVVRRSFLDLLIELRNQREVTILLSSHILSDVERVIDRVAFVNQGRVVVQEELDTLKNQVKRLCVPAGTDTRLIYERFEVVSESTVADTVQLHVANFSPAKLADLDAAVEHLNLEEIFLAYHAEHATPQSVRT